MRLYLVAKSKNNVGYTPDWIKVQFEEDGKAYELVLDIQGETCYDNTCLSCRSKGELIPWSFWSEDGGDIDLYEWPEEEVEAMFSDQKVAEIICSSYHFEVGVYPTDDNFEKAEHDVLSECNGSIEIYIDEEHHYFKEFEFETELNV